MISELSTDSPTERLWNFNDASGQTYMIKIPVDQPAITATLNWKATKMDEERRVGKYRLDLPELESKGYIRLVGDTHYQLRFLNRDGRIELALNREGTALDVGPVPFEGRNLISAGAQSERFNVENSSSAFESSNSMPRDSSSMFTHETTLQEIADVLNGRAHQYDIGQLQHIRKEMKGMGRRAPGPIFSASSVHDYFAFHSGAQGELQFNIGFEDEGFRHGVAFSFETSQSFPNIDGLIRKVPLFNEYFSENPRLFEGMLMWEWHEEPGKRSMTRLPQSIGVESVKHGRFIFIGKITPVEDLNVDIVLADFDRLLGLYIHVESGGSISGSQIQGNETPTVTLEGASDLVKTTSSWIDGFNVGHRPYPESAMVSFSERTVNVQLRHNFLQTLIYDALVKEFGERYVTTELRSASGGEIDFAILKGDTRILAELKVSSLARWCIRDSIGQLLEYGYLKESNPPSELWVFGVGACTEDDTAYLHLLRSKLGLQLFYRQFDEDNGALGLKH